MFFFSLTDFLFVNFVEVIKDQISSSSSLLPRNASVAAEVVKDPLLSISSSCSENAGGGGDNCYCIIFILFCYIFSGDYIIVSSSSQRRTDCCKVCLTLRGTYAML